MKPRAIRRLDPKLDVVFKLPERHFHSVFRVVDAGSATILSGALELHFLELPKLPSQDSHPSAAVPDARVPNWCRFLAAQTDQELEKLVARIKTEREWPR